MPTASVCKDHLGYEYPSQIAMCKHYGISDSMLQDRRKRNWPLAKILTETKQTFVAYDHKGIAYASQQEMCKHYNINFKTYSARIKANWSIENALLTKQKKTNRREYFDHLGNKYKSLKQMCDFYKINPTTYNIRITKSKMTIEEALTTPLLCGRKNVKDHLGNEFPSIQKMCKYHNCGCDTYNRRRKNGMTIKEALTKPSVMEQTKSKIGETNKTGIDMTTTLIAYNTSTDVTIQFEDGNIRHKITYDNFKKGRVQYPILYKTLKIGQLAYHVDNRWAFYVKCEKCGLSDVMTYEQMQAHSCCKN